MQMYRNHISLQICILNFRDIVLLWPELTRSWKETNKNYQMSQILKVNHDTLALIHLK